MPPPLTGYNNNVRHRGRIFHIQTEDSGVTSPRIMTHLFADGGRIVKSTRTDYSEHLGRDDLADAVRKLMKEQHKAMFVALRAGELDALIGFEPDEGRVDGGGGSARSSAPGKEATRPVPKRAAQAGPESGVQRAAEPEPEPPSYAAPRPSAIFADAPVRDSLFGETVMETSLDDAILTYLSEDAEAVDGSR